MPEATAQYACPHCQELFRVQETGATQTVACPHCGNAVTIQSATAPATTKPRTLPRRRKRSSLLGWLLVLVTLIVAVVLCVLVFGPDLLRKQTQDAAEDATETDEDDSVELEPDSAATGPTWTDATRKSLQLGGFEVKVVRAELGQVLGRDETNTVQTLHDDGLQFALEIRNIERNATLHYKSWYADSREGDTSAELKDNLGNTYPLVYFKNVTELRGHESEAKLDPSQKVRDILIFEIPAVVDRHRVKHFHLLLEAAPLNTAGRFRFRIPVSMVTNWQ